MKKTRSTFFSLLCCLIFPAISTVNAQSTRPLPPPEAIAASPWWARQMYAGQANVLQVDSAFQVWRKENPAVQTYFTRYYKHWRKAIGSRLTPEGFREQPDPETEAGWVRQWQNARSENRAARGPGPVWEALGPANTLADGQPLPVSWQGNVYCLDQSPSNPDYLYAGTENGAIFKSTDKGQSWECISNDLSLDGIGAIGVHPADPETVYFGQGNLVYKSVNGGAGWSIVLNASGLQPNAISVNPEDPQIVLVAAGKGLYRSADGGQNWTQLYAQTCWDLALKPDDGNIVYLLKNNPAARICEFYKSTDRGATWIQKTSGWLNPATNSTADNNDGGARMAVTNADPNRVYAVLLGQYNDGLNDNNFLGIYRSATAGESWTLPNANASGGPGAPYAGAHRCLSTFWFGAEDWYPVEYSYDQGFYNLGIAASDTDPNDLLVGFLNLFKSEDGAATFTRWGGYGGGPGWQHPDIQDIDINGADVWVCSDGGINKYSPDFANHEARNTGLEASDFWGFDGGWNEDILTGGRYHNGNTATIPGAYPEGEYIRLGGAESTTGYVHPAGGRKVMHSDISPQILPNTVTGPLGGFSFGQYPNEGYAGNNENSSEIEPDPRCYNHLYLGRDHTLQKSEDGGLSWTILYTFGSVPTDIVTGIEVSRSNPAVIYCVQNAGAVIRLWRSENGGQSFVQTSLPQGPTNGAFIALDPFDHQKIWLAWNRGGANTNKVFQSDNGGLGWTNLTTPTLNGHWCEQLIQIGGTDDGLYLATNLGVFYRSKSETDWAPCSEGLPVRAASNRLVPFYAKGKVRLATYGRGIWQADFAEAPAAPVVQPTVDKLTAGCARDTFYFDDYSMALHEGAAWAWTFAPAPVFLDNPNVRNPKVVFGAPGEYTATLTLNGQYTQNLTVSVSADCDAEPVPGKSLSLNGAGQYAVANGNLNLNSNTVTLTAWIKTQGAQNDWSGIVFARGGNTTAGISIRSNNQLGYHWNDAGWWWDSGLVVPQNRWTHVALVITPQQASIYLNGVPATHVAAQAVEEFDAPVHIGADPNGSDRYFKGQIDEVNIWNTALSKNQIRELMHLTRIPAEQPNLAAYYQFNETQGQGTDRVGVLHVSLAGGASRAVSTAPVGGGVSSRATVSSGGAYTFGATGLTLQFPGSGTFPNGELCASRLDLAPDHTPNDRPHSRSYWIINNFGGNTSFTPLDFIRFEGYGDIPPGADPGAYALYKRGSFADGDTWGAPVDLAEGTDPAGEGTVTFSEGSEIGSFSQFLIVQEGTPVAATEPSEGGWSVFPNPVKYGEDLSIRPDFEGGYHLQIHDLNGKIVVDRTVNGVSTLAGKTLPPGVFTYTLVGQGRRLVGKIAVFR